MAFSDFDESSNLNLAEYIARRRRDKPKGDRSMRRNAAAVLLAAALGGCTSFPSGPEVGGNGPHWGKSYGPPTVPGVKGPYGEGVAMAAPYDYAPPGSAYLARQMMSQSIPLSALQLNNPAGGMPGTHPEGLRGPVLSPP